MDIEPRAPKQVIVAGELLTLANYKEPLRAIPKAMGFGYYGTLLATEDGNEVQCHLCGKLFEHLGKHIGIHARRVKDYRQEFGLKPSTKLIGERYRQQAVARYLERVNGDPEWAARLSKIRVAAVAKMNEAKKKMKIRLSEETINIRGSCPDQILDYLKKAAKTLGRTPSKYELSLLPSGARYLNLCRSIYGTYQNALKLAELPEHEARKPRRKPHTRKVKLLNELRDFYRRHGRLPRASDLRRPFLSSQGAYKRHFGGLPAARRAAGIEE